MLLFSIDDKLFSQQSHDALHLSRQAVRRCSVALVDGSRTSVVPTAGHTLSCCGSSAKYTVEFYTHYMLGY